MDVLSTEKTRIKFEALVCPIKQVSQKLILFLLVRYLFFDICVFISKGLSILYINKMKS